MLLLPDAMVTEREAGVTQPDTALKSTVCVALDSPLTLVPLLCHAPPSTRHCAPAVTAWEGVSVTLRLPARRRGPNRPRTIEKTRRSGSFMGGDYATDCPVAGYPRKLPYVISA